MLVAKGRIALSIDPETWFDRFRSPPGVTLADTPPAVLIASWARPGPPPADPVDGILVVADNPCLAIMPAAFSESLCGAKKPPAS